jgi:hypothetical protein
MNDRLIKANQLATQIQKGQLKLKAVVVPKTGLGHYTVRIIKTQS